MFSSCFAPLPTSALHSLWDISSTEFNFQPGPLSLLMTVHCGSVWESFQLKLTQVKDCEGILELNGRNDFILPRGVFQVNFPQKSISESGGGHIFESLDVHA